MVFASVGITWQLFVPVSSPKSQDTKAKSVEQEDEKKGSKKGNEKSNPGESEVATGGGGNSNSNTNTVRLLTELAILGCDILIPAQALGWLNVDDLTVSSAAVLSTLLMGKDKWVKVQAQVGAL